MKFCCIGGPADGKWVDINDDADMIYVPYDPMEKELRPEIGITTARSCIFHKTIYKKMSFCGNGKTFYVLVETHRTSDEILSLFIQNYKIN